MANCALKQSGSSLFLSDSLEDDGEEDEETHDDYETFKSWLATVDDDDESRQPAESEPQQSNDVPHTLPYEPEPEEKCLKCKTTTSQCTLDFICI